MADGGGRFARLVVPLAGAAVKVGHVAAHLEDVGLQHLGEQLVVAVPVASVVQRDEKQVRAIQASRIDPPSSPVTASHSGPLSRSRMAVPQQEPADRLRLAVQDLLDQVVHDVAVVARETWMNRRRPATRQRECGQL